MKKSKPRTTDAQAHDPQAFLPERYPLHNFDEQHWQQFAEGASLLGLNFSPAERSRLEALYSHLLGVNAWLNLTRLSSPEEYLRLHVLDSLSAFALVKQYSRPGELILDLGSGAGYPGLPLAMQLKDRKFLLLDSRRKKVEFLSHTIKLLPDSQLQALCFRGREVAAHSPEFHCQCALVMARAVGTAADLLPDAEQLLRPGGHLLLFKGPRFLQEEKEHFESVCRRLNFNLELITPVNLEQLGQERCLVLIKKL
ncbi:MAG: 16S rRNA (guanine(527)-N(7))-methyltransferase RsmG [Oligosphaeraceae bacterium]|nr:16S rRNA (guanine(527)-N(7))-methyltransferase RsmG [Oligosphaeraceae bacterium]